MKLHGLDVAVLAWRTREAAEAFGAKYGLPEVATGIGYDELERYVAGFPPPFRAVIDLRHG